MKNRPARVKELILRELGSIVARELTFSAKLVTVHAVDLSADFKHCHVHVGVLGDDKQRRDAIHKLQEHRPVLQHELAKRVVLKFTPQLHFHLDEAIERGTKVMEIMRQIDDIVPPLEEDADTRMDEEEPIGNSEELVRFEEEEDEQGIEKPRPRGDGGRPGQTPWPTRGRRRAPEGRR